MIMNDDLRDMIMRNASPDELRDAARSFGMVTAPRRGHEGRLRGCDHRRRSRSAKPFWRLIRSDNRQA